jgi:hypothetical protein
MSEWVGFGEFIARIIVGIGFAPTATIAAGFDELSRYIVFKFFAITIFINSRNHSTEFVIFSLSTRIISQVIWGRISINS